MLESTKRRRCGAQCGALLFVLISGVGCESCGPPPEECPSDFVYANGEPITELSRWNHAQLSSKPEEERFHSILPQGEGGVVVMGALGDSASLSYSSASGEARNSTRQSSGF